jgi:hypothetical protein
MFTWWLGIIVYSIIIVIIFAVFNHIFDWDLDEEDAKYGTLFLIFVFAIMCLWGHMHTYNSVEKITLSQYENKIEIYSLADNMTNQGKFVLGTGSSDNKIKYYTLVGDQNNGYLIKSYDGDTTYVVPEENVKPYILEKYEKVQYHYGTGFIVGILFQPVKDFEEDKVVKREIHLPQNYISQQYSVDLK